MDLEGIMLNEVSQTENETNTIWFHLYVESEKQQTKKWTHKYREQTSDCHSRGGGGGMAK